MQNKSVCILDYGSGNVGSVLNMLQFLKYKCFVSNDPENIKKSSHIILPGVGSYGASMEKIKKSIPLDILENEVFKRKKPFLGICVGMQVLSEKGYEYGEHQGLGWIKGEVNKLETNNLPLPHIGWQEIQIIKSSPIFLNIKNSIDFYFLHSFVLKVKDENLIISKSNYNENFCSAIQSKNVFGVQFHPEKSQKAGMQLLNNFLNI